VARRSDFWTFPGKDSKRIPRIGSGFIAPYKRVEAETGEDARAAEGVVGESLRRRFEQGSPSGDGAEAVSGATFSRRR